LRLASRQFDHLAVPRFALWLTGALREAALRRWRGGASER